METIDSVRATIPEGYLIAAGNDLPTAVRLMRQGLDAFAADRSKLRSIINDVKGLISEHGPGKSSEDIVTQIDRLIWVKFDECDPS